MVGSDSYFIVVLTGEDRGEVVGRLDRGVYGSTFNVHGLRAAMLNWFIS